MADHLRITFAASAVGDLEAAREWYAQQQADAVGERLVREVIEQVETLAAFPDSGRIVPEFDVVRLRELIHPPFRIVYRREDDQIRVVRVWRSERLMPTPPSERE